MTEFGRDLSGQCKPDRPPTVLVPDHTRLFKILCLPGQLQLTYEAPRQALKASLKLYCLVRKSSHAFLSCTSACTVRSHAAGPCTLSNCSPPTTLVRQQVEKVAQLLRVVRQQVEGGGAAAAGAATLDASSHGVSIEAAASR